MEKEIWKDIDNYNGCYQVSNLGKVMSLKCRKKKILKQKTDKFGYSVISLRGNGKQKSLRVHRLVAFAFLENKNSLYCNFVDHIDGNKLNNDVNNLRFVSNQFNCSFCFRKDRNTKSSIYPGVTYNKRKKKWVASLTVNKKRVLYKNFSTEIEAFNAYNNKISELSVAGIRAI